MDLNRPMVTYPWMVKMLDGDHLAALILRQMVYWYTKMGCKPFYKAITPQGAKKAGDSWCEEMVCTYHQFERRREVFCVKVDHPMSVVTGTCDADGEILPMTHIVQSYNDPDKRQVFWSVNLPLLYWYKDLYGGADITIEGADDRLFEMPHSIKTLSGSGVSPYPVPTKNPIPITEITTKNNTEIVMRDGLAFAIAETHFNLRADEFWSPAVEAKIDQYVGILERVGIEAKEVYGFRAWYDEYVGVKNYPSKLESFEKHYRAYKAWLDLPKLEAEKADQAMREREARRANLTIS